MHLLDQEDISMRVKGPVVVQELGQALLEQDQIQDFPKDEALEWVECKWAEYLLV